MIVQSAPIAVVIQQAKILEFFKTWEEP
jgi:hypothetical protein